MTIYEIAELTGYSIATVSRVLNGTGKVRESTREHILKIVKETGYTPNLIARDLTSRRNRTVGLVLPGINSYFSPAVEAITRSITAENGHVIITSNPSGGWSEADEAESLRLLLSQRAQGVILFASRITAGHLAVFETWPEDVALVTVGDETPGGRISSVVPDAESGFRELFAHLKEGGRRRLAFIDGPPENRTAEDRAGLMRRLAGEYGFETRPEWIRQGYFNLESGAFLTGELLDSGGFDALVCANDFMAIGSLQTLHARGRSVPSDIALSGYDDLDISSFTFPALTTVAQHSLDLGRAALDLLLDKMGDASHAARTLRLPSKLIIRGTT